MRTTSYDLLDWQAHFLFIKYVSCKILVHTQKRNTIGVISTVKRSTNITLNVSEMCAIFFEQWFITFKVVYPYIINIERSLALSYKSKRNFTSENKLRSQLVRRAGVVKHCDESMPLICILSSTN